MEQTNMIKVQLDMVEWQTHTYTIQHLSILIHSVLLLSFVACRGDFGQTETVAHLVHDKSNNIIYCIIKLMIDRIELH